MMSWGSAWQKIFLLGNCSMRCSTSYIPVVVRKHHSGPFFRSFSLRRTYSALAPASLYLLHPRSRRLWLLLRSTSCIPAVVCASRDRKTVLAVALSRYGYFHRADPWLFSHRSSSVRILCRELRTRRSVRMFRRVLNTILRGSPDYLIRL